jgi:O-methyltransferase
MLQTLIPLENRVKIRKIFERIRFGKLYSKYRHFTMIPEVYFKDNLELCLPLRFREGSLVECGVWRGGMSAALAEVMGKERDIYLFDSFEGLPDATENDGIGALEYQKKTDAIDYHDNCKAEIEFAEKAMQLAGAKNVKFIKGWFEKTLPDYQFTSPILILRLDGDWYDSTMQCLDNLYDKVVPGGLILIDDYHTWEGCTKAVHDFLSKRNIPARIRESKNGVCYMYKY